MTKSEFVKAAKDTAALSTIYVKGGFGQPLTWGDNWDNLKSQWAWNRTHSEAISKAIEASVASGRTPFAFDCVCLVKGLLWGFCGDADKYAGGAVYGSNGVPDCTVDNFLRDCCTGVTTDFSNLEPGEYLYNTGHCGIYVGNGDVVECTPKWDGGVQVSKLVNLGYTGDKQRRWTFHGRIRVLQDDPVTDQVMSCRCPLCGEQLQIILKAVDSK